LTSNLPFSRWGQVFGEATIASAMIDRIVHHADVIALKGASYRIKHTAMESLPSVEADRQAVNTCSLFDPRRLHNIQPEPTNEWPFQQAA
jgi:IstB-like ATP binding protein